MTLALTPRFSVGYMPSPRFLAAPAAQTGLTVGQVAERAGVTPDAIRFYEREGLIPPPERTAASYRLFPSSTIDRVRFIRAVQRLGLRLREIRELLLVQDARGCARTEARALFRRRRDEVEAMLVELDLVRQALNSTLSDMESEERG